jgi:hypothetical protein
LGWGKEFLVDVPNDAIGVSLQIETFNGQIVVLSGTDSSRFAKTYFDAVANTFIVKPQTAVRALSPGLHKRPRAFGSGASYQVSIRRPQEAPAVCGLPPGAHSLAAA